MMLRRSLAQKGFTLVELAVVLAVAGTLFTGLYRMMSTGNQQLKDSASASQQTQLISSVKNFLSSGPGQNFFGTTECAGGCASGATFSLPLPSSAANAAGTTTCSRDGNLTTLGAAAATWCSALPSGFSAVTTNSYGQSYSIRVRAEATSNANTAPSTYSFMIMTTGGDTIADTSGGRISSLIGGDGGFVYTTNVCNPTGSAATVHYACGAYGAWAVNPPTYGFGAGVPGTVASRSYVASIDQEASLPWLARQPVPGDTAAVPVFNTMTTDMWLNTTGTGLATETVTPVNTPAPNTIHGTGAAAAGSYGGSIDSLYLLEVGNNASDQAAFFKPATDTTFPTSNEATPVEITGPYWNPLAKMDLTKYCKATVFVNMPNLLPAAKAVPAYQDAALKYYYCHPALSIDGNLTATGMVEANVLWAASFIYGTTSDIRLKKDIKPLSNELDNIMKLKPVTFRYKQDNKEAIGFIAQDLQKVYPQMVVGRPDNVLGVDYIQMLAPLVSSVQELKKENDQLRKQLGAQESEIKELQSHASEGQ